MFPERRIAQRPHIFWAALALLMAIVLATGINVWLVVEVRKEQRAIADILRQGDAEDIRRLGSLPSELKWQFGFTILVLLVLVGAAVVLGFLVRAYLMSQRSLREVTLLAFDILDSMSQAVITVDLNGKISSVNRRGMELLGVTPDSYGQTLATAFAGSAPLAEACRRVLQTGTPVHAIRTTVPVNGHRNAVQAECYTLRGPNDATRGTILHIWDITEKFLMEDQMRRMERFMGLGSLAAGLHHEIKNPLSALSLHVQLLEEQIAGTDDDEAKQSLAVIRAEVARIIGVLESFRDFASIDRLSVEDTDLARLLRQLVALVQPRAKQLGVEVTLDLPVQEIAHCSLDQTRFEQVLLNLMVNALEEMKDGGKLTIVAQMQDDRIIVEVQDSGRGIPENIRSRIFDPYFTTKSQGSGMGLAYCDKIIRQHGGQIDVETGAEGTTFRIILPPQVHEA